MSFWTSKITIGRLQVPRFMAAPLDGVTDSPLRTLIREFSPQELLFTEMRHVSCVAHAKGGYKAVQYNAIESPLCFQVSANSTRDIAHAVEKIAAAGFKMLNLNVGQDE